MGLEAIALSNGGCDIRGEWIHYHHASDLIKDPNTPIFLDVGNSIYKQFLLQVWPSSPLWDSYSNQVNIGDILEVVFGIVIVNWSNALSAGTPKPGFADDRSVVLFKIILRICLAAFCDSRMFGSCTFR